MEDIKYKNITVLSGRFLMELNAKGRNWFTLQDAYVALSHDMSENSIRQQLVRMTDDGLHLRVREGVYYVIPFEQDSDSFLPDWHLLAEPLADGKHYVGYYSALQIHSLITQPSLVEQIVVNKQIKPSEIVLRGAKFRFVYHNEKHFFGYRKTWIDNFNKVYCSDLEKTFVDCLYKPEYAGGIVEVAKAIYMSKDKINYKQLLDYAVRFDSQAVIKRLGYLLELLSIPAPIIADLYNLRSNSLTVLDTEAPKQGKTTSRWKIQQNVDIETIKSAIAT